MNKLLSETGLFAGLDAHWVEFACASTRLQLLGHSCSLDLRLASECEERFLCVDRGAVTQVKPGPRAMHRSDISFRADEFVWMQFWSTSPGPGYHDVFAMSSYGRMEISGDMDKLLHHLAFVKQLLLLPRGRVAAPVNAQGKN